MNDELGQYFIIGPLFSVPKRKINCKIVQKMYHYKILLGFEGWRDNLFDQKHTLATVFFVAYRFTLKSCKFEKRSKQFLDEVLNGLLWLPPYLFYLSLSSDRSKSDLSLCNFQNFQITWTQMIQKIYSEMWLGADTGSSGKTTSPKIME